MYILDTSFLVALFNKSDSQHDKALHIQKELINKQLFLLEYVVIELTTVIGKKVSIEVSKDAIKNLLDSSEIKLIPCSQFFSETLEFYHSQKEFVLSFIDCCLLVSKKLLKAEKIISFDESLNNF